MVPLSSSDIYLKDINSSTLLFSLLYEFCIFSKSRLDNNSKLDLLPICPNVLFKRFPKKFNVYLNADIRIILSKLSVIINKRMTKR